MNEQTAVRILYKKLLRLYPREFRERLEESMQQTFNDLYKARRSGSIWFGFILWTFAETSIGIFREHVLLITEGTTMKTMISNPRFFPGHKLYSVRISVYAPRMGHQIKSSEIQCLSHVMGRSVVPVNRIHCRPYANGAQHTSGKQHPGEASFSVVKHHTTCHLRMAVDSTYY